MIRVPCILRFSLLVCCLCHAAEACVQTLDEIYNAEKLITNTGSKRIYTLCSNSIYTPGTVNTATGLISSGDFPLVCKSNCLIRCGTNGRSSNNCRIKSTGTYAIFMFPSFVFSGATDASNVQIQGVTIEGWTRPDQIPVAVGVYSGTFVFKDCIFRNNRADPLFLIDQFIPRSSSRVRKLRTQTTSGPNFLYPVQGDVAKFHRRLDSKNNVTADAINAAALSTNRRLAMLPVTITFDTCTFDSNQPVKQTRTQGGLSIIRFRAADPLNPFDQLGTLNAVFKYNTWEGNDYLVADDQAEYRSLIDFFSSGTLTMERNCFRDSPTEIHAVVTAQETAKIVNVKNFVNSGQASTSSSSGKNCDFVALMTSDYDFDQCAILTTSGSCQIGNVAAFCFPGDSMCSVEDKGKVMMKDIMIGDRVMVDTGKYESIYSFGHYDISVETEYLKLITKSHAIELTKDHMLFTEAGRSMPASMVKIGDKLQLASGDLASVHGIQLVRKRGAYAPFTPSGTIVVNGVKASSFLAFQNSETLTVAGFDTGLTFQFLCHAFEMPHRMWCQYASSCRGERYTQDGISTYVALPHKIAQWIFSSEKLSALELYDIIVGLLGFLVCGLIVPLVISAKLIWMIFPDLHFKQPKRQGQ